jgi:peptidoglycan/LPS O-acetylase OafA/YrhL
MSITSSTSGTDELNVTQASRTPLATDWRDRPAITGHQGTLDGIRVIAAFAVLVTHVAGQTGLALSGTPAGWATARGDVGVPIFFTLSGLLLYRPWARAVLDRRTSPDARAYLWRRGLRILPAYWAVVLIAMPTLDPGHARAASAWAQQLLLVQIYDPRPWWQGTGPRGLAQMWSLAAEVSFYLLLPVIAAALAWIACRGGADTVTRARRLLGCIAALGASSYLFTFLLYYPSLRLWLGITLPAALTWFAPGMALAVVTVWAQAEPGPDGPVRRLCRTLAASSGACWLIAIFAFMIACTPVAGPASLAIGSASGKLIKTALYTIVAAAIVAPAACQPAERTRLSRLLGNRPMRFLGKISYGVYLWQLLIICAIAATFHLTDAFHGGTYTAVDVTALLTAVCLLSVGAATLGYYLIEKPAQHLYRLVPPRHAPRHARPWGQPGGPRPGRTTAGQPRSGRQPPGRSTGARRRSRSS